MDRTKDNPVRIEEKADELAREIAGDGDSFFDRQAREHLTAMLAHIHSQQTGKPTRETTAERRRKIKAARKVTRTRRTR